MIFFFSSMTPVGIEDQFSLSSEIKKYIDFKNSQYKSK